MSTLPPAADLAVAQLDRWHLAGIADRFRISRAERQRRQLRRLSRHERLPRGRGLAGVFGEVGVAHHKSIADGATPNASAAIWIMIVLEPCPMSTAPL